MIAPPAVPRVIDWFSFFVILIPLLLALLPFLLVGKVIAKKAEKVTGLKPKKWLFLVATLFLSVVLFIAVADLARSIIVYQITERWWSTYSYSQLIKGISLRMVVVLFAFPLLGWSWFKATVKSEDEKQEKSELLTRKNFLGFELFLFGVVLIFSLGTFLYYLFNWILGVGEMEWSALSTPLSYGLAALLFFVGKLYCLSLTRRKLTFYSQPQKQ